MTSLFLKGTNDEIIDGWDIVAGPVPLGSRGGVLSTLTHYRDFARLPGPAAQSMANVACAVYSADKRVSRKSTRDHWTRNLHLSVPVAEDFPDVEEDLDHVLGLLSGDVWRIELRRDGQHSLYPDKVFSPELCEFDRVALFSGGLDSLTGALESLGRGERLLLVGHFDSGAVAGVQRRVATALPGKYSGRFRLVQFRLSPRPSLETSTRSRTMLFLSLATLVADGLDTPLSVQIAENGFIGLNVPLTGARIGSYTTRTTHPRFMGGLQRVFDRAGLSTFENPYALLTKGEVVRRLQAAGGTLQLVEASQSCSKAGARRFQHMSPMKNCGCCFPCLLRRAALHSVGWDDASSYWRDAFGDAKVMAARDLGRDLRALLLATHRSLESEDWTRRAVMSAGAPLTPGYFEDLVSVVQRGFAEVAALVTDSACGRVRQFIS